MSRFAIALRSKHDHRVGQNLLTRFEDLLSGVKYVFYPSCLSGVGSDEGVKLGVCMRTYSTTSAAALDRIDMFGTRLLRLRIRRTSTRQYTLLETESPSVSTAGHCANFPGSPEYRSQHAVQYLSFVSLIEFAKNSGEFRVQMVQHLGMLRLKSPSWLTCY